ncbi:MAG: tetratricopeptide repeat protein [Thiomargarita sp.]|nr:tetratricopeptide repeat protein [Thiomargarita sp.]
MKEKKRSSLLLDALAVNKIDPIIPQINESTNINEKLELDLNSGFNQFENSDTVSEEPSLTKNKLIVDDQSSNSWEEQLQDEFKNKATDSMQQNSVETTNLDTKPAEIDDLENNFNDDLLPLFKDNSKDDETTNIIEEELLNLDLNTELDTKIEDNNKDNETTDIIEEKSLNLDLNTELDTKIEDNNKDNETTGIIEEKSLNLDLNTESDTKITENFLDNEKHTKTEESIQQIDNTSANNYIEHNKITGNNIKDGKDNQQIVSPADKKLEQISEQNVITDEPNEVNSSSEMEQALIFDSMQSKSNEEDAQRILETTQQSSKGSSRLSWLFGLLAVIVVGMGGSFYYLTQPSSFVIATNGQNNSRRPMQLSTNNETNQADETFKVKNSFTITKAPDTSPTDTKDVLLSTAQKMDEIPIKTETPIIAAKTPVKNPTTIVSEPPKPQLKPQKIDKPIVTREIQKYNFIQPVAKIIPNKENNFQKISTTPESKPNSGIHIVKKRVKPQVNQQLLSAYTAFQQGNYQTAQFGYSQVLQQDSKNYDALLGLASIHLQQQNIYLARQYYNKILQYYPKDSHAQVSFINTLDTSSSEIESQLKQLLQQSPESAYIHFNLGNIYARQGRWNKAQAAYFNALHYDKIQANYAYNLAISLDKLNQQQLALSYYQRALQLVKNQSIHFDVQALSKRIRTLKKYVHNSSALANLPK